MRRLTNNEQKVLIVGKCSSGHCEKVAMMIVEPNGKIRFDASTSMRIGYCGSPVYYQGQLFTSSLYSGSSSKSDTLTPWRTSNLERFPNGVFSASAAVFGNKLLIIGGFHPIEGQGVLQSGISNIVYELDEQASQAPQGTWRAHVAKLNMPRVKAAAIEFEGKLFVCGGGAGAGRSVESFDPIIGFWQVEPEQMIKERSRFSLVVYEDELYAVGGDDGNTTIEKRNKATKKWQLVADSGQHRFAAALVGSKIFFFGGGAQTFDFFDLDSKKWASQDVESAYFDEAKRQLPLEFGYSGTAVLITPVEAMEWTSL